MVQLYHQGRFGADPAKFRLLFAESWARLMAGVAAEEFARRFAGESTSDREVSGVELQPVT
jgi:hypothetical protein